MNTLVKITILIFLSKSLIAQNHPTGKTKFTIGIEYGFAFKTLSESDTYGYKQIYGLSLGIPVNQFTFEFGLLRNDYGIGVFKDEIRKNPQRLPAHRQLLDF